MEWTSVLFGVLIGSAAALLATYLALRRRVVRLRAAEERAQRQERLAELGALTGGLAHEIKNPLSTIGLNVQLASEAIVDSSLPDDDKATLVRRVETVEREATRLANILNDFLRFAGRIKLAPVEADLREVVEELVDFYRPQCDQHKVVLRADLPAAPVVARVDPALVKQALLNLLINATQVMAAQDAPSRELMIRLMPAAQPAAKGQREITPREIAIHVIDTGPGIPAEKHAEIFRPYVTGRKGGSGLGLAVTRRIVEEHGGRIDLFSEPGKGSDFMVRLPIEGPADSSRAAEDDDARKTVLDRLFTRAERQA
ncbi:MAG: ATP-binding protein [Planctomycetota bacterium]|nr:ATP-binding protein [Planctomycetota bacterium]